MSTDDSDLMRITPLGGGQEVGRSCVVLEFKGKTVMWDCGVHPAYTGIGSLPYFGEIELASVDVLLVTHFHLDHCAALPYLLEKMRFKGRVFMTHATKAIYKWMLHDYVKVSNIHEADNLYTEKEIDSSMSRIETIDYHQDREVNNIRFRAYPAGHVLGACMFLVEIAGVKVLYTGDYSCEEDRHLIPAEVPQVRPDVLIIESTYGVQSHESRVERESRFTGSVHDIVQRGGRCLIPAFALGRAQELLLILDEFWENHPELQGIPIYYGSALAQKCMKVYQGYINAMNGRIRAQYAKRNPFVFRHISTLRSVKDLDDIGPSVVIASPGFMTSGPSRELFDMWCSDQRNGVIIAGYSVEGTLAHQIRSEPQEITTLLGQKVPMRMSVTYVSFSAHADCKQTSDFVEALKPPHIILVHGKKNEMERLRVHLRREHEMRRETTALYHPPNTETVALHFRGERIVRAIGSLAESAPQNESRVSGLVVKKGFTHHLVAPEDLSEHMELTTSVIAQRLCVPYNARFSLLEYSLTQVFGALEKKGPCSSAPEEEPTLIVYGTVSVSKKDSSSILLEWEANAVNDMVADSVLAVVMQAEGSRSSVRVTSMQGHSHSHDTPTDDHDSSHSSTAQSDDLFTYLQSQFGDVQHVSTSPTSPSVGPTIMVQRDGKASCTVTTAPTSSVSVTPVSLPLSEPLAAQVVSTVLRVRTALDPSAVESSIMASRN